ncbi:PHB depolymerase family esterase [uncultured Dokdonia sp.]|uniref:carboxylesterase family protein n=1 Tax=uncultured Dokdonia sp. TaxID=575653 RepID=UPI002608ED74|nr:PHB depolymerase family esterase [uncultured Dokdonia sp.]
MKTTRKISLIIALCLLSFNHSIAQITTTTSDIATFTTVEKNYPDSAIDGYNLYVPKSCTSTSEAYPVIVFLQGGLGVGGDVDVIYGWGLPKMLTEPDTIDKDLRKLVTDTFVVIMPHIEEGQFYSNEDAIQTIIKEVATTQNIDTKRIYLTGLSRGGHGTWGLASRIPETFAAVAPICGGNHGISDYQALAQLPIWNSHNTGDNRVSYNNSERTISRLEATGISFQKTKSIASTNYKKYNHIFTATKSDSHDAWTEMYSNPNVYNWFLKYRKE